MLLIACRTPILIYTKNNVAAVCLANILNTSATYSAFNEFLTTKPDNDIQNHYGQWNSFTAIVRAYKNQYQDNNLNNRRMIDPNKDYENAIFKSCYSDGQYTGVISPQANDFYQSNNNPPISSFNNISMLKCIFQIAFLANAYDNNVYYTTTNSIIICWQEDLNIKFTGKYWAKPFLSDEDLEEDHNIDTYQIINKTLSRIRNDPDIKQKINNELGLNNDTIKFQNITDKDIFYDIQYENFHLYLRKNNPVPSQFTNDIFFLKHFFTCTLGLEDFIKQEFALFLSGVQGHAWDMLLRFFIPEMKSQINKEFKTFKEDAPSFSFIKHYGTPIASYMTSKIQKSLT